MKKTWILAVALLGGSLVAAPAQAALTMTITDSSGASTVYGETSPGLIAISGSVGLFEIDLQATASNAGSGELAEVVSTSLNLTSTGADFFTVSVTEDNFGSPSPNENGEALFESILNASAVTGGSSFDASSLIDGGVLLSESGISSTDTFYARDRLAIGTPFSITHEWTIYASGPGESVAFNLSTRAIPEPGVLGLLGIGIAGLAFALRRRRSVAPTAD